MTALQDTYPFAAEAKAGKGYGIGVSAPRPEDRRLVTGQGRFTDDIDVSGQAWAVMVRSTYAHGELREIATDAARKMPGVLAIVTGRDLLEAGYGTFGCKLPLRNEDGTPLLVPERPILPTDRVRYVGETVALVVAESLAAARAAAEMVEPDVDPLSAVVKIDDAAGPAAPRIHDIVPANTPLQWAHGDADAVDTAFAQAAHVTSIDLDISRIAPSALEPRAALAQVDPESGRLTLQVGCQGVFGLRNGLAEVMNLEPEQLRVLSEDVGGSFGSKGAPYPEYAALLHAARIVGRPVKWRDERSESLLADNHGRSSQVAAELAMDAGGRFLAMRVRLLGDLGAWLTPMGPNFHTVNIVKNVPGPYRTPLLRVESRCVFTNRTPIGPYRGAGRPEGVYIRERLIDAAARDTGIDPIELRRRNVIPPEALPFEAPSGQIYDSGEFETVLDKAVALADWDGFEARRAASAARGLLRGRGIGLYLEVTAPVGKEMGGLRFGADGRVTIITGTKNYGQGHHATFAQIVAETLGLPFGKIDLVQGDSDELLIGGGSGGSRSTMASGSALLRAADVVIDKARAIAGHRLEVASEDLEFIDGSFQVAGTDRAIGLDEIVNLTLCGDVPSDLPQSLDSELVIDTPPSAFPNGAHICEVEIDPQTGSIQVDRYAVVDDFGTIVNPMLVEGQVHGGIVQGIGQAFLEGMVYDPDGQPLTGSFLDYGLPHADEVPDITLAFHPVPARTNPLGAKGCGEAGVTGALPALMNAVADALVRAGADPIDMPATPERVWRALAAVSAKSRQP